ncbi:hypothetical protein E4N62_22425 [Streptomyces sp. MNU76]|nr:hypothetical protein [Streptomyces sp. MNU76]MCC9707787.1 hypothetical protein [Streptomyces sp. MNU76]
MSVLDSDHRPVLGEGGVTSRITELPTGSNRSFRARLHRWKNGRSIA